MNRLLITIIFVISAYPLVAQRTESTNPIIWADVPDNAIIRVDDTYYMSSTTTHMTPGIPIMKSKDLVNWELINHVHGNLIDSDEMNLEHGKSAYSRGSWASSIRYHSNKYYVSTFSGATEMTHIYVTSDIEQGEWQEHRFKPMLHDHTLFFEDGHVYMIYGKGEMRIIELNPDCSGVKEGGLDQVIIPDASSIAGENIAMLAEGAQLYKVNGKYYLFNITWPVNDMRVAIVHRADKITGPYEGRVFLKDRGIAQGGIVDTPKDKWYAFMFRDFGAVGRMPYLMPVKWEDGWPVVDTKDGKVPDNLNIPIKKNRLETIVTSDEFSRNKNARKLPHAWQWNHNANNELWSVDARNGYLRLTTGRTDSELELVQNLLTQRTFGPTCSASVALELSSMNEGDCAGISAFQKKYGYVGIKKEQGEYFVVMSQKLDDGTVIEQERTPLDNTRVYLRIDCDFSLNAEQHPKDIAYFYYSLDNKSWHRIGEPLQMVYTVPHFIGYRFALFNYATEQAGGYVDFDFYRVSDKIIK